MGDLLGSLSVLLNQMHRFLIADQLQEMGLHTAKIVLEPVSRNTAPAACIAALMAARSEPESLVLLAPSDHVIADADLFAKAWRNFIAAESFSPVGTLGGGQGHA
jgi:mannose-1-phosphate guanylyltransferase